MSFYGVIDSGVGGLTILRQILQSGNYNLAYVADHAFCPYGQKPNDVIFKRICKIVNFLQSMGVDGIVLACNTASVYAPLLKDKFRLPICDVITPTCDKVLQSGVKQVALLATKSTIDNGVYQDTLSKRGVRVVGYDCSAFVPFVERCATDTPQCFQAVDAALSALPQARVDAVILGCTHFPLLKKQIAYYCNGADIVECCCPLPQNTQTDFPVLPRFFTTGSVNAANAAASWYGDVSFTHVDL